MLKYTIVARSFLCLFQDPGSGEQFKDDQICKDFLADKAAMDLIDNTKLPTQVNAR